MPLICLQEWEIFGQMHPIMLQTHGEISIKIILKF